MGGSSGAWRRSLPPPRSRTLAYLAQVALRTLEVGDLEERITALEQAVRSKQIEHETPIFDVESGLLGSGDKETT